MELTTRAAVAIAAVGIASAGYQHVADAADRRRFPPPGQLADIGGRRIHLLAEGEGTPAVVIVPALGDSVLGWVRVQRAAAAAETTIVVCDRACIRWRREPSAGRSKLAGTRAGVGPILFRCESDRVRAGHLC